MKALKFRPSPLYFHPATVALQITVRCSENTDSSGAFQSSGMIVRVKVILVFTSAMTVHQNTQSLTCSARWNPVSSA